MCGIVANIGVVDPQQREAALRGVAHRGSDACGEWISADEAVYLGHRRLAIVDLSDAGTQPMDNEDGDIKLVCNGEIYNAPQLRRDLKTLGHRFRSGSDSEVVLHAYEQWGDGCVERFEGMFAFALWDGRKRRLLAVRDRLGIKPLYWGRTETGLALASELGGLLPLLSSPPAVDPESIAFVLTLGYVPSPRSIWQGIKKLPPGHRLVWEADSVEVTRYWAPPDRLDATDHSDERWVEMWHDVLRDHLQADVPLGLFLSGGIDSSATAAGLVALGQRPTAMTMAFPESPRDESSLAAAVAEHLGLPMQTRPFETADLDAAIGQSLTTADEPQGYSALLSMSVLSAWTAEQFKVVIAGDGGDEVLGGYRWYQDVPPTRSLMGQRVRRLLVNSGSRRFGKAAAGSFAGASMLHRHAWRRFPRFLPEEVERVLSPTGLHFDDRRMLEPLARHWAADLPPRRALQRVDLMTFCADSVLPKVDRASMAHGLEVRVPFLDRRVVEWGLSRPMESGEETALKPVLHRYLQSRIPAAVLDHPKQGFSVPLVKSLDQQTQIERIESGWLRREGVLDGDWQNVVHGRSAGQRGRLWTLYALSTWADAWCPHAGKVVTT